MITLLRWISLLAGVWLLGVSVSPSLAHEAPERPVLAHYMLCCSLASPNPGISDYVSEIDAAREAGIDGFALNFGSVRTTPQHLVSLRRFFEAASHFPDFSLVLSFDQSPVEDAIALVKRYSGDPASLTYHGAIVVSGWGQTSSWADALRSGLKDENIRPFLIPHIRPTDQRRVGWTASSDHEEVALRELKEAPAALDGIFIFNAGTPYRTAAAAIVSGTQSAHSLGKLAMVGIVPYYRGLAGNSRVFESDGFSGMRDRWLAAIKADSDWVQLVTWNDWSEATYLEPFPAVQQDIHDVPSWRGLLQHSGFLKASRYYIDWFKNRKEPEITTDRIYYFYRPHLKTGIGVVNYEGMEYGRPRYWDTLTDQLFFANFLTREITLSVRIGKEVHRISAGPGVTLNGIPMSLGLPEIDVTSGGETLAHQTLPLPIGDDGVAGNFNYIAGEVSLQEPQVP